MQPIITVFCAFTRLEMIDKFFEDLLSTDLEPERTNLAFIIDCNEPKIYEKIMNIMNNHTFKQFLITRNYDHQVNEVNITRRRQRIAEVKEQSKDLINALDGELILSLEDDTVFKGLQVKRLAEALDNKTGLVSTYEAGRWYNKIIGVWEFDNIQDPTMCWTCLPEKDITEVDATGFYCYLTRKELYLAHEYNTEIQQPWGPDVNFGLWLRKLGYINKVDWEQPTGHNISTNILTPDGDLIVERFIKTNLGWERLRHETTN